MKPRGAGPALILAVITVGFYWKTLLVKRFSLLLGYEGANQAYAWFTYSGCMDIDPLGTNAGR